MLWRTGFWFAGITPVRTKMVESQRISVRQITGSTENLPLDGLHELVLEAEKQLK